MAKTKKTNVVGNRCSICNKWIRKKNVAGHKKMHNTTSREFEYMYCHAKYKTNNALKNHYRKKKKLCGSKGAQGNRE